MPRPHDNDFRPRSVPQPKNQQNFQPGMVIALWRVNRIESDETFQLMGLADIEGNEISFESVMDLWSDANATGSQFRLFWSLLIASCPFRAFRFETPPVTKNTLRQGFRFVLFRSNGLDRPENRQPFESQFQRADSDCRFLTFPNLGKNATLVVPTPKGNDINHCHLGSFLRTADQTDCIELWKHVGFALKRRVGDRPVWLSTAGGGVAWLHVRLDDRPKYYRYEPFKTIPTG